MNNLRTRMRIIGMVFLAAGPILLLHIIALDSNSELVRFVILKSAFIFALCDAALALLLMRKRFPLEQAEAMPAGDLDRWMAIALYFEAAILCALLVKPLIDSWKTLI